MIMLKHNQHYVITQIYQPNKT